MKENNLSITDIFSFTIYTLINALFVYKYSSRIISQFWAASLVYIVIVSLLIVLLFRKGGLRSSVKTQNSIYFFLIAFFAIVLTFSMIQFDPQQIRVGRYPAMYDWITKLLSSEFPYASDTNPSGFPFLFVMAMPFYFLGDLGFFQIFSFLTFAVLLYLRHSPKSINRFRLIFLLVTSPIFLYEIVVRSELFSNMVIVMLYLAVLEAYGQRVGHITLFFLGIIGGLLLSTRGVVLLIYIIILGYFLKRQIINHSLFFISMFVGFFLSLAPFLIWDWTYFINFGPFAVQLSYIPNWLLTLAIASSVLCALTIRSLKGIYSSVSFILFGVVSAAFVLAVLDLGWHKAVLGSGFDIAYFCLALPYLLISLEFAEKGTAFPDRVFAAGLTGNGVYSNASKGGTSRKTQER
ncbi:MAG: hypothetical protein ACE5K2_05020 [Candidatus Zixiibacteriota bacterium]